MPGKERYDELEQYLKDQADSHRMYPSDFLWQNIQRKVHGDQRWPALTLLSILIISALIIGSIVAKPVIIKAPLPVVVAATLSKEEFRAGIKEYTDQLEPLKITERTVASVRNKALTDQPTFYSTTGVDLYLQSQLVSMAVPVKTESLEFATVLTGSKPKQAFANPSNNEDLEAFSVIISDQPVDESTSVNEELSLETMPVEENRNEQEKTTVELNLPEPASISRWELQFYITPSASYRRLVDENKTSNGAYITAMPMSSSYFVDVNQVVRHNPAMGLEAGVSLGYKVTKSLTIKTGLQFNLREYDIDAYAYDYEPANVAMINDEPMNAYSRYRNTNGSEPVTLKNRYFELALPIAIDYKKHFSEKFAWGIAASIQPTYVFNKQPFLISTDYKNYTEGSTLLRNWNINTGVETYISYKMGKYKWQLGPQFRYQQLPTFSNKYPIKEFLLDYGLKIGFTKSLR